MELLRDGVIGDVLSAKAWNSQLRGEHRQKAAERPAAGIDYDTWLGPAPMVPYPGEPAARHLAVVARLRHAATWGTTACTTSTWPAGGWAWRRIRRRSPRSAANISSTTTSSSRIRSMSRVEYDLDGGKKKQLVFEQRIWSPYFQEGAENGMVFYGTKGMMNMNRGKGWTIEGVRNAAGEKMSGKVDGTPHHRDWLKCISEGGTPICDIESGHLSAAVCHLGNIATRVRRVIRFDPKNEQIIGDEEAAKLVRREYREGHWAVPKGV